MFIYLCWKGCQEMQQKDVVDTGSRKEYPGIERDTLTEFGAGSKIESRRLLYAELKSLK